MPCKIPDSLSNTDAAIFPFYVATAAHGLFSRDNLGMSFPKVNSTSTDEPVLVWGAALVIDGRTLFEYQPNVNGRSLRDYFCQGYFQRLFNFGP